MSILLVPCVVALSLALVIGVSRVGGAAADRARAEAIADMAALAAVREGADGARTVAQANRSDLVDHTRVVETDVVMIQHRGIQARAAAEAGD